jgi:Tol biopolymer transport system component
VSYLPGGKTILYSGTDGIGAISPSGKISLVDRIPAVFVQYVPGYVLFVGTGGVLYGMPFDSRAIKPTGAAFPLLEGVDNFQVSPVGTMIVHRGKESPVRVLYWFDEAGRMEPLIDKPGAYGFPRLSPDGRSLALAVYGDDGLSIWVRDLTKGTMSRLTFNGSADYPAWMPDGRYLLYRAAGAIYQIRADGSGSPRRVLEIAGYPESVSPDGRRLAYYVQTESAERDIWIAPLEGTGDELRAGKPEPFANTAADEIQPVFSPDGKWIAYASSESEDGFGVYVRPASGGPGRWLVSAGVYAAWPVWAPFGHRLFFFNALDRGRLMDVDYTVNGESFVAGAAKDFGVAQIPANENAPVYFVSGNGDRAGAVLFPPQTGKDSGHSSYTLFLNYLDEIRRRGTKAADR